MPIGDRIVDKVDAIRQKNSPGYNARTVNRFEQALGRAVRSTADYAAVLLVGTDIAAFIGQYEVQKLFEARTRAQIDLGREIAQAQPGQKLEDVLSDLIGALLRRDEGWKEAHRTRVKAVPRVPRPPGELTALEEVAVASRTSWLAAKRRNFQEAIGALQDANNRLDLHDLQHAELLYRIASYQHELDPVTAQSTFQKVFSLNSNFPRPNKVADKSYKRLEAQSVSAGRFFGRFSSASAAVAQIDQVKAKLSFGMPADTVEQGLKELGEAIGATASRPEKETGRGPDVMWILDGHIFCIEAKNEKIAAISKTDCGQLLLSRHWCLTEVADAHSKVIPIFVTNSVTSDREEDVSFKPLLMNEEQLMKRVEALRSTILNLTFDGPLFDEPTKVQKSLSAVGLLGGQLLSGLRHFEG